MQKRPCMHGFATLWEYFIFGLEDLYHAPLSSFFFLFLPKLHGFKFVLFPSPFVCLKSPFLLIHSFWSASCSSFKFSCGFALVCERDENRLVAENILNLIIRNLQEYCQIILQPSEVNESYECAINCMCRLTSMYDAMLQWPIIVSQPIAWGMYVFVEVCRSCIILVLT